MSYGKQEQEAVYLFHLTTNTKIMRSTLSAIYSAFETHREEQVGDLEEKAGLYSIIIKLSRKKGIFSQMVSLVTLNANSVKTFFNASLK